MKGFKPTGNGPKNGHSFSSKAGFSGSTGRQQEIRSYSRSVPKRHKFAEGGVVKVADPSSSVVRRDRPVTAFDAEHGGKSPLAPGYRKGGMAKKKDCYAEGGRVGNVGAAIKMVKTLMSSGESAQSAAKKAAAKHGVSAEKVSAQLPKKGMAGDPQMLARGGLAGMFGQMSTALKAGRAARRPVSPPPGKVPVAPSPPRAVGVEAPVRTTGFGAFNRNPLIGR